jgi:hypothetical protein
MTIRLIGALLCGAVFMLVTATGAFAAEDKTKKKTEAGVAIYTSASNVKSPPQAKTGGTGNTNTPKGIASGKRQHKD